MADKDNFFGDEVTGGEASGGSDESSLDDFFQPAAGPVAPQPKEAPKPKAPPAAQPPKIPPPAPPKAAVPPPISFTPPIEEPAEPEFLAPPQSAAPPPAAVPPPLPPVQQMESIPLPGADDEELFPIKRGPKAPPPPFPTTPEYTVPTPPEIAPSEMVETTGGWGIVKMLVIAFGAILAIVVLGGGGYLGYKFYKVKLAKKPVVIARPVVTPVPTNPIGQPPVVAKPEIPPVAVPPAKPVTTPPAKPVTTPVPVKPVVTPAPVPPVKPVVTPPPAKPVVTPPIVKPNTTPPAKPAPIVAKPAPTPAPAKPAPTPPPAKPAPVAPVKPVTPAKIEPFVAPPIANLPPARKGTGGKWTVQLERVALLETLATDADKARKAGFTPYRVVEPRSTPVTGFKVVMTFGGVSEANDAAQKILNMGFRPVVKRQGTGAEIVAATVFSEPAAKEIIAKLEGSGLKGAKIVKKADRISLQALRIGPFDTEAAAQDAVNKIRGAGFPDATSKIER